MSAPPLRGVRVCDFGWVWSGPQVGAWLAEFGADVIKVEHGKRLDNTRLRARPFIEGREAEGPSIELHPYFHQVNHGKRSITLNLKRSEGQELAKRLIKLSDVVIENLSPGAMSRLGLDYEAVAAFHPDVIYLSMSAFGQTGPLAQLRAYAPIMSSLAGVESLIGYHQEAPIGMMNYGLADPNAAVHGLLPVLAALFAREQTGRGAHIDLSQFEALIAALPEPTVQAMMTGNAAYPTGNRHPAMVPHGIFRAAGTDRWVTVAVSSDQQWAALAPLIGFPAASLTSFSSRLAAIDQIEAALEAWTASRKAEETSRILNALGIASSPVMSPAEQRAACSSDRPDLLHEVVHPILGSERLYSVPWRMSKTPPRIDASAPLLGAHNDVVFRELLGIAPEEIKRLKADGIIA